MQHKRYGCIPTGRYLTRVTMTNHPFGGLSTLIKLDLLGRYLSFFNIALQRYQSWQNFRF
jgi:hypothetical protein